jgi:gliding motility-associated lipoprotein GldD
MRFLSYITLLIGFSAWGCGGSSDYAPKRTGYFRIALPERKYVSYPRLPTSGVGGCPFTFEYPDYAEVLKDSGKGSETVWLNVVFPRFRCNLYLSYMEVDSNLADYLEECRQFVTRHEIIASAIDEQAVINRKEKVYGAIYNIEGNTATNFQFYLTDSARNFIRGALYFYAVPNKDSIAPALNFVKADIEHLINTFRWEK